MEHNPLPVKALKCVVRKYNPESIKVGFIMEGGDTELKAQCVQCGEIL